MSLSRSSRDTSPFLILLFTLSIRFTQIRSDFQFCYKGATHSLTTESRKSWAAASCPAGLLFREPVELFALQSSNRSAFCIKEEICQGGKWVCGRQAQNAKVQLLSHIPVDNEKWDFVESRGSVNQDLSHCSLPSDSSLSGNLLSRRRRNVATATSDEEDEEFPAEAVFQPAPQKLIDQTKRMFYFLSHLNPEPIKSPLRAVALLEKTVELVGTICDPNFLNPIFLNEILRGFLFLLKEQGTERVLDVNDDDFILLTNALDSCAVAPNPLTLAGETCVAKIHVETVKRFANGKETTIAYQTSEPWSFKWALYDPVVDAMWFAVNIVHGTCFATFRQNINLHHKFQVAMEELFKNEILERWTRPVQLHRNYEYDHIFLGPVNKSLQVLDACTEGAYVSSPFLHRLKRPTDLRESRLKRSVAEPPNIQAQLGQEALCLQTGEERIAAIREIKANSCP